MDIQKIQQSAINVRNLILDLTYSAGKLGVHVGSALSVVDILAVLYSGKILHYDVVHPDFEGRDFFILSKGHAYAALYAMLCECGFVSKEELFNKLKSTLYVLDKQSYEFWNDLFTYFSK